MDIDKIGTVSTASILKPVEIRKDLTESNQRLKNQKNEFSKNNMAELVSVVNEFVRSLSTKVEFFYDRYNERHVILVKEKETGEVIREIPPKEMVNLVKQLEKVTGIIYHNQIWIKSKEYLKSADNRREFNHFGYEERFIEKKDFMYWEQKTNRLNTLLQEELSCFKEILYLTQEYHKILSRGTTNALLELLDEREIRINLINRLENERKKLELNAPEYESVIDSIKKDIKDIALNLVRIDAELLDILAMSKESIIKELSKTTNKNNIMISHRNETSRFIDIKQE